MVNRTLLITIVSVLLGCLLATIIAAPSTARAESTRSAALFAAESVAGTALAHCEVPCGIYDDHMMIKQFLLDAETMRKASAEIVTLSEKPDAASLNTLSRWVMVKEEHSRELQHMNAWYFMTQRVKVVPEGDPGHAEYLKRLAAHHLISVSAMKAAQSLDPAVHASLTAAIKAVEPWYPPKAVAAASAPEADNWIQVAERQRP